MQNFQNCHNFPNTLKLYPPQSSHIDEVGIVSDLMSYGFSISFSATALYELLYGLAIANISPIGYLGSGAALRLTVLRPAIRTDGYFATRIAMLRQQFKYPRGDVFELANVMVDGHDETNHYQCILMISFHSSAH